jgi:hypothetical protein
MASPVKTTQHHASPCVPSALAPNCNEVIANSRKVPSQAQCPTIRPHKHDPVKSKHNRTDGFLWWLFPPWRLVGLSATGTSCTSAPLLAPCVPSRLFPVSIPEVRHQAVASSYRLLVATQNRVGEKVRTFRRVRNEVYTPT